MPAFETWTNLVQNREAKQELLHIRGAVLALFFCYMPICEAVDKIKNTRLAGQTQKAVDFLQRI